MSAERPRRFRREHLAPTLDVGISKEIVAETRGFLERRYKLLATEFQDIADTNFNPFLLLITAPVYNTFSPLEVAERLQLGKAFHGDDTAFGRFGEEKLMPLFGATAPPEKRRRTSWEPIDKAVEFEGRRFLVSVKAGPWTMSQSHANAMVDKFPQIHQETGCPILIGIMYGRYENLNNKPEFVDKGLGRPDWFDYLVGRDFWEFVSGVQDVHKHIFKAIRRAQREFADDHKDETFHEKLIANRLKIAASVRKAFDVGEADFWETLFNNMF